MWIRKWVGGLLLATAAVAVLSPNAGNAGFTDALKKKITDKATKKAEEAVDRPGAKPDADAPASEAAAPAAGPAKPGGGAADGKVASVSTRFDFVPGDSVMFYDDFTRDELGEFPARWRLVNGTFEVVESEGERWLRCTSVDGRVRMKVPASLPEFWTLEFDFHAEEPMASALTVSGLRADDRPAWGANFPQGSDVAFSAGAVAARTPYEGSVPGRHHVMLMARGTALKMYLDRQRMVNVPDVSAEGMPVEIEFRLWASTGPRIANVRFAEGCRPAADLLAEGRLVTYGIRFASGSDAVLPESAPVLRQIAGYLEKNPAVKLRVVGHTDDVGTAADNLDLSKRRAAAVARVLADQFGVAAGRLDTDGRGAAQAVASNAKPEGRAMNRRVEFTRI